MIYIYIYMSVELLQKKLEQSKLMGQKFKEKRA